MRTMQRRYTCLMYNALQNQDQALSANQMQTCGTENMALKVQRATHLANLPDVDAAQHALAVLGRLLLQAATYRGRQ